MGDTIHFRDWEIKRMGNPDFRAATEEQEPAHQEARQRIQEEIDMGESYGTCGHRVFGLVYATWLKGITREKKRCLDYSVLCPACLTVYERLGLVLSTEAERDAWLRGESKDETDR